MKDLELEIQDLKKQINDIYNQLVVLQKQDLKLFDKLKRMEWFLYEE